MTGMINTSKQDPATHLLGSLSQTPDAYIENMEAQGQSQFVNSTLMPTEREGDFLSLGFTFSPPDPNDPLFCQATLPTGWTRQADSHSMWSHIVDERGINRVSIFYKAAFYDRRAFARVEDVGARFAADFIHYQSNPDYIPGNYNLPWDILTSDEQEAYKERLYQYLEQTTRHPDLYPNGGPVAEELARVNR